MNFWFSTSCPAAPQTKVQNNGLAFSHIEFPWFFGEICIDFLVKFVFFLMPLIFVHALKFASKLFNVVGWLSSSLLTPDPPRRRRRSSVDLELNYPTDETGGKNGDRHKKKERRQGARPLLKRNTIADFANTRGYQESTASLISASDQGERLVVCMHGGWRWVEWAPRPVDHMLCLFLLSSPISSHHSLVLQREARRESISQDWSFDCPAILNVRSLFHNWLGWRARTFSYRSDRVLDVAAGHTEYRDQRLLLGSRYPDILGSYATHMKLL